MITLTKNNQTKKVEPDSELLKVLVGDGWKEPKKELSNKKAK